MVRVVGQVDAERLDYALRRRMPAQGSKTWTARQAIDALAYACCQHMQGRKRETAQAELAQEATTHLQQLVWPGVELWHQHTSDIVVRRWEAADVLPVLATRGSFARRGARLAELLHARIVQAATVVQLNDPAQRPPCDEDDRWAD